MISVGFKTDKGMLRSGNEDALFVLPDQNLYIVADGVGGHHSGQLASRMAVGYIAQYVALHPLAGLSTKSELKQYFQDCLEGANDLVFTKSAHEKDNHGMATTAVLTYLRSGWAYVVNVGDSRVYLLRDGVMHQITEDHTCVRDMIRSGLITEEEGRHHPDRNMITRAVGGERGIRPDFFQFETCPGDLILMCTDGLYGEVSEERITEMAEGAAGMHELALQLVDEANECGGRDNISVICIRIQ